MESNSVDRQLLFAMLALQNQVITGGQLVTAFSKWADDKSTDLDQILVHDQALNHSDYEAIAHIVSRHSDPAKNIESKGDSGLSSTVVQLKEIAKHSHLSAQHKATVEFFSESFLSRVSEHGAIATGVDADRFRSVRPLENATGGMGVIHIAEDTDFGRAVAVKHIREDKRQQSMYRQKFLAEAEIAGKLEHPGIVPIYGRGINADGSPYYAMRLVRGENLKTRINDFHEKRRKQKITMASVEFRNLIDRLTDVAQTINYAHSRGVLHRDLKPDNIMLGQYGETLVIDWGLAKIKAESDNPASNDSDPLELSNFDYGETQQGTALGTLGYSPPEQVAGRVDEIDERSDIFGLGAILFNILTDSTPIATAGRKKEEIIRDTITGNLATHRFQECLADRSLAAICRKALSVDRSDRYASVQDFIDELESWKADLPVNARRETISERLFRVARRNRSTVVAVFWAAVLVVVIGISASLAINHFRRAAVTADQQKAKAIEAEQAAKETVDQQKQMNRNTLLSIVGSVARNANAENGGGPIQLTMSDFSKIIRSTIEAMELERRSEATLLLTIGESFRGFGEHELAISTLVDAFRMMRSKYGRDDVDTLNIASGLAHTYVQSGAKAKGLKMFEDVLERRRRVLGAEDVQTVQSMNNLGYGYEALNRPKEAMPLFIRAYELQCELLGENDIATLTTLMNIGFSYESVRNYDDAIVHFEKALERLEEFYPDSATLISCMSNLASCLERKGDKDRAQKLLEEVIEISQKKFGEWSTNTTRLKNNLVVLYEKRGEFQRAFTLAQGCFKAAQTFVENHPSQVHTAANLQRVALEVEEYQIAKEALLFLMDRYEQLPNPPAKRIATLRLSLAEALLGLGEYSDCKAEIDAALNSGELSLKRRWKATRLQGKLTAAIGVDWLEKQRQNLGPAGESSESKDLSLRVDAVKD